ncbi:MAG TPA: hypothetical protein VMV16_04900 [Solirubrobacteraceae bacterium]|nr:hypothetical protein [Solirubrobacteraceae bacterium]
MTDTELDVETLAQRIAARGRDALVERLRVAYSDAAAVHADIVSLDDERIETLVQTAANRADGLQWRRALAGVAAEELDVTITEALSHPAVARAQTLVGAPSYEQSLAELIARPVPPASTNGGEPTGAPAGAPTSALAAPADGQLELEPEPALDADAPEPASEADAPEPALEAERLEAVEADDEVFDLLPEPDPVELDTALYDAQPEYTEQDAPPTLEPEPFAEETDGADGASPEEAAAAEEASSEEAEPAAAQGPSSEEDLQVTAVHLGGVANLPTHQEGLGLRLSRNGLDILEGNGEIIGRLVWDEIDALEVPHLRTRRRRQQAARARLVVRTAHGDASFEIPGFASDELRDRIEPVISRYGRH